MIILLDLKQLENELAAKIGKAAEGIDLCEMDN